MRAVVQRTRRCEVRVENHVVGSIERGILVYLGVEEEDTEADVEYLAGKILGLRIFPDGEGKMNLSVSDLPGTGILAVSQFTLCADVRKGRRPSYSHAADPEKAEYLYTKFVRKLEGSGLPVAEGVFQAHMEVDYINDGPVTLLLDSKKLF
jgi:D-tyrosyl-tRNA(Tyr) deacylase